MDPIKPVKAPAPTVRRKGGDHIRRTAAAILALKPGEAINLGNDNNWQRVIIGLEVASDKRFRTYMAGGDRYVVLA